MIIFIIAQRQTFSLASQHGFADGSVSRLVPHIGPD